MSNWQIFEQLSPTGQPMGKIAINLAVAQSIQASDRNCEITGSAGEKYRVEGSVDAAVEKARLDW